MQPHPTIHNNPKNHPKPSRTTQKLLKKAKTCHKRLHVTALLMLILKQTLALIVIWNNGIYTWLRVCLCVNIFYKTSSIFSLDWLFLLVFKVIHLMFRAMSNAYFRNLSVSFFLCSFRNFHIFFLHIKLPSDVEWL